MTEHTLAETQVAGFGLANGAAVARLTLTVESPERGPAVRIKHEHDDHPDPLDDRDVTTTIRAETYVTPTRCEGPRTIQPGGRADRDRVVVEHHDHAPRAYVRHERRDDTGAWRAQSEWELHPAEGVVRTQRPDDEVSP